MGKWEAGDPGRQRKDRPKCHARTRAGGACLVRVEPNKARCRFHGGLLAEVNLRLTPLTCAILLRDDFTQVRR